MNTKTCSIEGCNDDVRARGWCTSHYNRWHASGSPVASTAATTECKLCGRPTQQKATGPRATYCSLECRAEAQRTAQRERARVQREAERATRTPRDCTWCTEPLPQGTHGRTRYHEHCAKAHKATYAKDSTTRQCSEHDCDRPMRARNMCYMHYRRWARAEGLIKPAAWDDRRKRNYQKRRAQKMNLPADNVIPREVYERDEWVCGICADPVSRESEWPDPMSPSLDHVMPLAKGGHHTYANTQLAHLVCNIRKSDTIAA